MSARVWTREALDAAHPEVKAAGWEWCLDEDGGVTWGAWCLDQGGLVWVEDGRLHVDVYSDDPAHRHPPAAVCEAVILASKGLDSLGGMADALEARALGAGVRIATAADGDALALAAQANALHEGAAMLRRGRVDV